MKQPPTSSAIFRIKFRFQFVLLWLPVIAGIGFMVVGGYLLGVDLAPQFGIDPNMPLSAQLRGGQYFWTLMVLLVVLLLVGVVATFLVVGLTLRLTFPDPNKVREVLMGRWYPDHWYA